MILLLARRAYLRARAGSGERLAWLAKLVPVLVIVGAAGGAWASYKITDDHARYVREKAETVCRRVIGFDPTPQAIARCVPLEIACEVEARRRRDALHGAGHYRSDDPDQQPAVICTKAALAR